MRVRASTLCSGGANRLGESGKRTFQLSFNRFLQVAFQGSRDTSDGGLIAVWELDRRLGLSELIKQHLTDSRANNARFSFADLPRQSIYIRLAGYEDEEYRPSRRSRTPMAPGSSLALSASAWMRCLCAAVKIRRFGLATTTSGSGWGRRRDRQGFCPPLHSIRPGQVGGLPFEAQGFWPLPSSGTTDDTSNANIEAVIMVPSR